MVQFYLDKERSHVGQAMQFFVEAHFSHLILERHGALIFFINDVEFWNRVHGLMIIWSYYSCTEKGHNYKHNY